MSRHGELVPTEPDIRDLSNVVRLEDYRPRPVPRLVGLLKKIASTSQESHRIADEFAGNSTRQAAKANHPAGGKLRVEEVGFSPAAELSALGLGPDSSTTVTGVDHDTARRLYMVATGQAEDDVSD